MVPVRAGLLVHKPERVHELMGRHPGPHAPGGLQGEHLAASGLAQVGPAPDGGRGRDGAGEVHLTERRMKPSFKGPPDTPPGVSGMSRHEPF